MILRCPPASESVALFVRSSLTDMSKRKEKEEERKKDIKSSSQIKPECTSAQRRAELRCGAQRHTLLLLHCFKESIMDKFP
jgi:hypothetical protein